MYKMKFAQRQKCFSIFFVSVVLLSTVTPAISFSMPQNPYGDLDRAYNVKSNNVKKTQMFSDDKLSKEQTPQHKPVSNSILKQKEDKGGFQWGNIMGMALKMFTGPTTTSGTSTPIDKTDPISQITNGDFSWTKIISLGLQLVLSLFGSDTVAIDKMDHGSPIEAFLTAIIAYFTGSNDAGEVSVMAKQATELWGIVISLLDALRTSFSQRSFEARAIGSNDLLADAAVASTSMLKSVIKTYNAEDDICIQRYVCEANRECADETSDTGYLFCQMASYLVSYAMDGRSYIPFEIINDAARVGRVGEDCSVIYKECKDNFF